MVPFRFKMLFRIELCFNMLICLMLYFSLGQSHAEEILITASFSAPVTGTSGTTECNFKLSFTDVEILKSSKVKCGRIKKTMTINSFTYEMKSSMHLLRETFKDVQVFFKIILILTTVWAVFIAWLDKFFKASHNLVLNWKYSKMGGQLF